MKRNVGVDFAAQAGIRSPETNQAPLMRLSVRYEQESPTRQQPTQSTRPSEPPNASSNPNQSTVQHDEHIRRLATEKFSSKTFCRSSQPVYVIFLFVLGTNWEKRVAKVSPTTQLHATHGAEQGGMLCLTSTITNVGPFRSHFRINPAPH